MSSTKLLLAAAIVAVVAVSAPAPATAQNTSLTLALDLDGDPNTPTDCKFETNSDGIEATGSMIYALGSFPQSSSCGQGGGNGTTGPAEITMTPSGNVPLNAGDPIAFQWSATADACRFDGSSLNGVNVSGWENSGSACWGSSDCAAAHSVSYPSAAAGIYTFSLSCVSGTPDPGGVGSSTDTHTRTVTVNGGGTTPPTPGSCTGPAGTTRQTTVTLAAMASTPKYPNVPNVDTWADIFGQGWVPGVQPLHWPGYSGAGVKLYVKNNHFIALKFTVPQGYPTSSAATGWAPYGEFESNSSAVTQGMTWAMTISEECGDFNDDVAPASREACYAEFTRPQNPHILWMVGQGGSYPGACFLTPGTTYYLNIMPASLSNPSNGLCTQGTCRVNLQNSGVFDNGRECTPQDPCG